jgi:hypothetical protein
MYSCFWQICVAASTASWPSSPRPCPPTPAWFRQKLGATSGVGGGFDRPCTGLSQMKMKLPFQVVDPRRPPALGSGTRGKRDRREPKHRDETVSTLDVGATNRPLQGLAAMIALVPSGRLRLNAPDDRRRVRLHAHIQLAVGVRSTAVMPG